MAAVSRSLYRSSVACRSAERRMLPATDLFRRHVLARAATGRLPAVAGA